MIRQQVTIINKLGLHARAAAKLVATASEFESSIQICKGSQQVDAKSIMPVMMLAASKGTDLELNIEGPDEQQALDQLVALINDYFGEGE
ncbi:MULTISPECIES: HPr family phosphocarrier protein [Marinobacter]|uniref:HPr family phosphocarrier protein n=1 Tax=Marinobacter xestospongiae TaxID=994319 RepID=A0ABU3VS26_9GAMM|nr:MULTISPECIES: HPr family phosphocarrier protein [Marinobacter]MCG8516511.1 HPr family phosphocarrier protein [Pseudomonadales bacterium]MCK7566998.1 HPr family phosphocarrier protein [Marinobacter xestospongiae]MDV2077080.1 HPr family phosphocarrier protein [Marinobacter xestospongiae]UDL03894.1 HPr family phosphocarrier protein [Marinobacter sp. CA1]